MKNKRPLVKFSDMDTRMTYYEVKEPEIGLTYPHLFCFDIDDKKPEILIKILRKYKRTLVHQTKNGYHVYYLVKSELKNIRNSFYIEDTRIDIKGFGNRNVVFGGEVIIRSDLRMLDNMDEFIKMNRVKVYTKSSDLSGTYNFVEKYNVITGGENGLSPNQCRIPELHDGKLFSYQIKNHDASNCDTAFLSAEPNNVIKAVIDSEGNKTIFKNF